MNDNLFIQTVNSKAKELGINPLLLLSGIEGLYTFRDMKLSSINAELLDSLILTIFALRIGDKFHELAEKNLSSANVAVRNAADFDLKALTTEEIFLSSNPLLPSFAQMLGDKSVVRRYHEKALEVAAVEVQKTQTAFGNNRISTVVLTICKNELNKSLDLGALFN